MNVQKETFFFFLKTFFYLHFDVVVMLFPSV